MKLIYIAGAYTEYSDGECDHTVEKNIQIATAVADYFFSIGWNVFCPHMHSVAVNDCLTYEQWMECGSDMLSRCDAIALLSNWVYSGGATLERQQAIDEGKEIWEQDDGGHWTKI